MPTNHDSTIDMADILIVDDDSANLHLLSELLGREGYQVRPADSPQAAIFSAISHPPALILLDVKMPEIDGFEVCKRLKQDERIREVPVIFISALQDVEDKVQGFEAGGVDFISKPVQEEEVLARVQTHLELRNMQLNLERMVAKRTAEVIESEQRFRATFDQAAVGIAHVSPEGRFLLINKKFCDIVGYSEDEMLDLSFKDITHPDDLETDLEYFRQVLNGEIETYSMDKRYYRKDASIVWVNLTVSMVFERGGSSNYFVSVIKDITELKRVTEELGKSEAKYRGLVDNSIVGIFNTTIDGRFKFVNDAMVEMFDFETPHQMTSQKSLERWSDRGDRNRMLTELRQYGKVIEFETEAITHTGRKIYVVMSARQIGNDIIGIVMDITKRKQAETTLRQNRDFLEHLISAVPDAIYSIKIPERTINWANDSFNVMGYEPEEYIGVSTEKYYAAQEYYEDVGRLQLDAIRKGDDIVRTETMARRKDGRVIPAELTATFYREEGKVSLVTAFIRDISERKQAEVELKEAYREIKQLQVQLEAESTYLQEEIKLEHNFENIIGQSEALKYVLHRIEMVAPQDSAVIILGETGTGKELVARALHQFSTRNSHPLVKVNCAALPHELIESELFGRERGAFTGATTTQIGRFELADKSTIFLDEIGELPLNLQGKLLRVLESGQFERLGNPRTFNSDARIIAATNRNLEEEVKQKRFREDLWYRLKIFPITLPPLRDRIDDIPLLVDHFVQFFSRKMGKNCQDLTISQSAIRAMESYHWPGNVRELKHVVEGAMITTTGKKIYFDIPKTSATMTDDFKSFTEMEREYLLKVLAHVNWNVGGKNGASTILGMPVSTLQSRMKKLGIERP